MNHELLPYYERELIFLRKVAGEFAAQYPERASALKLTPQGSDDPHVERILQGFALIAGRIQHKLDDEFPEITNTLLELMYPQLVKPVPAMGTVQFAVDPELSKQREGQVVPRGTLTYSAPIDGVQCKFRTAYDTRLWPLAVTAAKFGNATDVAGGTSGEIARHALRIEMKALGGNKLMELDVKELRFRLGGDGQAAHWIYELLFNQVKRVLLRPLGKDGRRLPGAEVKLEASAIQAVGFGRDQSLLPAVETSFQGYRLMQEYFCYPQKFLFFDLSGLERMPRGADTEGFEVVLLLEALEHNDRALLLEAAVNAEMFQLGCTPVINLFTHGAGPIRLSHTKTEYTVIPDVYAPLGYEVYSVDRVISEAANRQAAKEYQPFYSFSHAGETQAEEAFWFSSRRPSTRSAELESDVFLAFVDRNFKLSQPADEAITVKVTCSNRALATRLQRDVWGELDLESGAMIRTRLVDGPTRTIRQPARGGLQWRLISHLSLNHLSVAEGGVNALRELLRLYDPTASSTTAKQIDGLMGLKSSRKVARMASEHGFVFSPGVAIDAQMDEDKFSGGGAYLLASVLEHFFGLYCAMNSFTQLRVSTGRGKGVVWQWPIRSGEQAVA